MAEKHETWMPLFVGDYLRDTQKLQAEQHGAYLLLIMAAWSDGGSVPDDPEDLAAIARVPLERWQSHTSAKVLPFFRHEGGRYVHDRVRAELDRARTNVAQKSRAGAAGAAARWQKDGSRIADANAAGKPEQWRTDAPSPSTTEKPPKAPRRGASFDASQIDLPEWLPRDAWAAWCCDRKKRGNGITEAAASLQIRKLDAYRSEGFPPVEVIEHSIAGGFQGLYPPKRQATQPGVPAPVDASDWRQTQSGIRKKGLEIGVGDWDEEAFAASGYQQDKGFLAYKARVFAKVRELEDGPIDRAGMARLGGMLATIGKGAGDAARD